MTQRRRRTYVERRIDDEAQVAAAALILAMRITQAQRTAQGDHTWMDDTQAQACALFSVN